MQNHSFYISYITIYYKFILFNGYLLEVTRININYLVLANFFFVFMQIDGKIDTKKMYSALLKLKFPHLLCYCVINDTETNKFTINQDKHS